MFKLDKYNTKIVINLDNGIYLFDNQSATGKTRLTKRLKEYQAYGEPVASYTYNDKLLGIPIETVLIPDKFKLIVLDRYDMYNGDGADLIQQCANNTIILIDCKQSFEVVNNEQICFIEMGPEEIEVTL